MAIISKTCAAKSVAPEDLRVGDFVAFLSQTFEFPSFLWNDRDPQTEVVRLRFMPHEGIGEPLRIKAICLPFVLVKKAAKKTKTIDIRRCQLARLDTEYAKLAWKGLKAKRKC